MNTVEAMDIVEAVKNAASMEDLKNIKKKQITKEDIVKANKEVCVKPKTTKEERFISEAGIKLFCGDWTCDDEGVYKFVPTNNKDGVKKIEASPIKIILTGQTIDVETGKVNYILSFISSRTKNKWKKLTVSPIILGSKNKILELSEAGIPVSETNAKHLVEYLADLIKLNYNYFPEVKTISHMGWFGNDFVPYQNNISFSGNGSQKEVWNAITEHGDFEKWRDKAYKYRHNKIVKAYMDSSIASVLIEKISGLCFVVNLWGNTGYGKTVALKLAASIWGDSDKIVKNAGSTMNGLISNAAFMNNMPAFIDETQTAFNLDKLIYQLTEGVEKTRLNKDATEKLTRRWCNVTLFTGERPATNNRSASGVANRVIELEVENDLFDDYAEVMETVQENYGHAGRKLVEYIQSIDTRELKKEYRDICSELQKYGSTGKQINSVAFIVLANRIVVRCIFQDEKPMTIEEASILMKSEDEISMPVKVYNDVISWVVSHHSYFDGTNEREVWGKEDKKYYYVIKSILNDYLEGRGTSFDAVKDEWDKKGYLERDCKGKYTISTRIDGRMTRCVKIMASEETDFETVSTGKVIPFNNVTPCNTQK